MAQTVLITLTEAGLDTGPFNLYSNVDGFLSPFETSVAKASLVGGYLSVLVPDSTTTIRVKSMSVLCSNYIDLEISGITTTTTTSTTTSTTSTSSTTTTTTTLSEPILIVENNYTGSGGEITSISIPGATITPISGSFPLAFGETYSAYITPEDIYTITVNVTADDFPLDRGHIIVPTSTQGCQTVGANGGFIFTSVNFVIGDTITIELNDDVCP